MSNHIDIVFEGPPGPDMPRLIEIEDADRNSIKFGEWIKRDDGYWVLRIRVTDGVAAASEPRFS